MSRARAALKAVLGAAAGGFVAMAAMGYVDTLLAPRGLNVTLGSFGAVCTLLFAAPKSPVSQVGVCVVVGDAAAKSR